MITVTVTGAKAVQDKVLALAKTSPQAVADALTVEAELTMTDSKQLVPVVTGALRASGMVQKAVVQGRQISVTMGYGGAACAYALVVHENPRAGHTQGLSPQGRRYKRWSSVGQWKFLEQPVLARAAGLAERLLPRIMARLGG